MTECDQAYIRRGTLRNPTDIEQHKPVNGNSEYIDDLSRFAGWTIGIGMAVWAIVWAVGRLS